MNVKKTISGFKSIGYTSDSLDDDTLGFYKNYWYQEFRDLLFLFKGDAAAEYLTKNIEKEFEFIKTEDYITKEPIIKVSAGIKSVELFLFPNGLHFFSIELYTPVLSLSEISELTNCARDFEKKVIIEGETIKWVNWIEKNCLNNIKISSSPTEAPVSVDEFSGSKFKLFTVVDLVNSDEIISHEVISDLLFDIGTVSPINAANGNHDLTPSTSYFEEIMEDKINVFKNYAMLPLFDSFTTVGYNLLNGKEGQQKGKYNTHANMYFRIYLYNLFLKYNLFRYNSKINADSVKTRDEFEGFLNTYNISHISYNFLPNLIYHGLRKSLQIDNELKQFQDRINRISQAIQEKQQKRTNLLLGAVSVLASISSAEPVFGFMENTRDSLKWGKFEFYFLVSTLLILLVIPLIAYLFPDKKRKFLNKWRNRK
ncbi:MAG: hypothetical protein EBR24_05075 [Flavobacteriia bacterium]|nr:hypothetical protein [Flavobacteriia bacterium]